MMTTSPAPAPATTCEAFCLSALMPNRTMFYDLVHRLETPNGGEGWVAGR